MNDNISNNQHSLFKNLQIDFLFNFEDIITNRFRKKLSLHDEFINMNLTKLNGNKIKKKKGESKFDFVKRLFKNHPLTIINNIIYSVDTYQFCNKIKIYPKNQFYNYKQDKKIFIREKLKIQDIKYLTYVGKPTVVVKNDYSDLFDPIKIYYDIEFINNFTCEIILFAELELSSTYSMDILDSLYISIHFNYMGLKYNENLPIWIEYLLEGAIYQSMGNSKISIFNYFAAFDSFIQTVYNDILSCYNKQEFISSFKRSLKEEIDSIKEETIDHLIVRLYEDKYGDINGDITFLLNDDIYYILYDKVILESKKEINSSIQQYLDNYKEIIHFFDEEIYKKIDYYANQNRRLIVEKLKDIEHLLYIDLNNPEFSGLSYLKGKVKKIELYRNDVAHGNPSSIIPSGNEFYIICSYILSIIYHVDLHKSRWKPFIND